MIKAWSDEAWEDYLYWYAQNNKSIIKKIHCLIEAIERSPFSGIGKPEALKYELSGKWSRRITEEDRLIYAIEDDVLYIYSCKDPYIKETLK